MSLSCSCGDYGDFAWYYGGTPEDVKPLATKRSRKCCSCGCKLKPGDEVAAFPRWRSPVTDIEERICGDEVPLATWHSCETCWGLMLAVEETGMCFTLGESMKQQIADYRAEESAFKRRTA